MTKFSFLIGFPHDHMIITMITIIGCPITAVQFELFQISNGNRTKWSSIQGVIG